MKILYVGMDAAPYSDRSHEVKVAEQLAALGHDVHLLVERAPLWTTGSPQPNHLTYQIAPVNNATMANAIGGSISSDYDVGFASSVSGAPLLAAWKKTARKPVVTQVLDCPLWRLQFGPEAPWLRQWAPWFDALLEMNRLVCNTHQTVDDLEAADELYGKTGALPPREVVYYGIDTQAADAAPPSTTLADHGVAHWFVGVSRLVPYKGFDHAIAALRIAQDDTRATLGYCIIGAGEDAERLAHLAMLAGVNVAFAGGITDHEKFSLIKECNTGLYLAFNPHIPSQFPIEALYCGKPCITANIPINEERFGGHVARVHPFNTQDAATAMLNAVSSPNPPDDKTRAWIHGSRSFTSHAHGILDVLESVQGKT